MPWCPFCGCIDIAWIGQYLAKRMQNASKTQENLDKNTLWCSGELTFCNGKSPCYSWENPLFRLGHFQLLCKRSPEGTHRWRGRKKASTRRRFASSETEGPFLKPWAKLFTEPKPDLRRPPWPNSSSTLWLFVKIAIENGYRNSGFSHEKKWVFVHSYVNVYQRVIPKPLKNDGSWWPKILKICLPSPWCRADIRRVLNVVLYSRKSNTV